MKYRKGWLRPRRVEERRGGREEEWWYEDGGKRRLAGSRNRCWIGGYDRIAPPCAFRMGGVVRVHANFGWVSLGSDF